MRLFGLFGPPNIHKLVSTGNIQGLIKALSYKKDFKIRQSAAYAIGRIKDLRAIEALIAALNESEPR